MSKTPLWSLPQISDADTDHVTPHNHAIRHLEWIAGGVVKSATTAAPPGSPADGDVYLLRPTGLSGAWAGQQNKIAYRLGNAWVFLPPPTEARLRAVDSGALYRFDGSSWSTVPEAGGATSLDVYDNGSLIGAAESLNFIGADSVTQIGSGVTIDLPSGGSSGVNAQNSSGAITKVTTLNFRNNISMSVSGSTANIDGAAGGAASNSNTVINWSEAGLGIAGDGLIDDRAALQSLIGDIESGVEPRRVIQLPPKLRLSQPSGQDGFRARGCVRFDNIDGITLLGPCEILNNYNANQSTGEYVDAFRFYNCRSIRLANIQVTADGAASSYQAGSHSNGCGLAVFWGCEHIEANSCGATGGIQLFDFMAINPRIGDGGSGVFDRPSRNITMAGCWVKATEHGIHTTGCSGINVINFDGDGDIAGGAPGIQRLLWIGPGTVGGVFKVSLRGAYPGTTAAVANISQDLFGNPFHRDIIIIAHAPNLGATYAVRLRFDRLQSAANDNLGISRALIENITIGGFITGCRDPIAIERLSSDYSAPDQTPTIRNIVIGGAAGATTINADDGGSTDRVCVDSVGAKPGNHRWIDLSVRDCRMSTTGDHVIKADFETISVFHATLESDATVALIDPPSGGNIVAVDVSYAGSSTGAPLAPPAQLQSLGVRDVA